MTSTPLMTMPPGWVWVYPQAPTAKAWPFRRRPELNPAADAIEAVRQQTAEYLTDAGVVAAATFTVAVPDVDQVLTAWLVLAWAHQPTDVPDPLTVLATTSPHDVASMRVDSFISLAGDGVRAVSVYDAHELGDSAGDRPLGLTSRYVVPWEDDVAFLAQFSTLSVVYGDEMVDMFDAIIEGCRRE